MGRPNRRTIVNRAGVSAAVAIGTLATGIGVAAAAGAGTPPPTAAPVGSHQPWGRSAYGDLGAVGAVSAVSTNSITVRDAAGAPMTFAITPSTVVRRGGTASTVAALAVGQNVAVMVSAADASIAATIVVVPAAAHLGDYADGVVTTVSTTSITVKNRSGASSTYAIDGATTVREGRSKASLAALAVGERVQVTTAPSSTATAASIDIDLASVGGTVISVAGDFVTVGDHQGFHRTIKVGGSTTYSLNGAVATLSDVSPGVLIVARGLVDVNHTTLDALSVAIAPPLTSGQAGVPGLRWGPAVGGSAPRGPGLGTLAS